MTAPEKKWPCFDVTIENQIAHIVLSRPQKRNAMNADFWMDLPALIAEIDNHSKARVIVISSTGPQFSAGIDLSMLAAVGGNGDKNAPDYGVKFYHTVTQMQKSFNALEACRIPVIAAVQGGCYGAGVDLITACDMRYGTKDSYITIAEINVGMTADVGTFPRILNHMPEGIAREIAYTGRKMSAQDCQHYGLYNAVYDSQEQMLDAVMEIAKVIASKPPLAIYGCKRILTYSRDHNTQDALDYIGTWNMSMLIPTEMFEAMQARKEKRTGKFMNLPARPEKL